LRVLLESSLTLLPQKETWRKKTRYKCHIGSTLANISYFRPSWKILHKLSTSDDLKEHIKNKKR